MINKILSLRKELTPFNWWESKRLYFNIVYIFYMILVEILILLIKPGNVNFFLHWLVILFLFICNIFYFSGFIIESILGASELKNKCREISLIYFIFLLVFGSIISLILFIIPII